MGRAMPFFGSLVGKKVVMAVTGAVLFLFIVGHLLGNLQIFLGPEAINGYSRFLHGVGELLWVVRGVLLLCLVLHVISSIQVSVANAMARPVGYASHKHLASTFASRTMMLGGPLIFLYVVYHLMMFTFLTTGPGYSHTDVYSNLVLSFQVPAISAVYILAMLVLGLHLYHGIWSMCQTLGFNHPRYNPWLRAGSVVVSILIAGGYIAIPLGVLSGLVR